MNFILAAHPGKKKVYTFRVSDELAPCMKKGLPILVETKRGRKVVICTSAAFSGAGAEDVALMMGAYDPIRPVLGIINEAVYSYVAHDIARKGQIVIESAYLCVGDKDDVPY